MNRSNIRSAKKCDRLPFSPIIEGGVAPKTLKLSVQWQEKEGKLVCHWNDLLDPAFVA